MMTTQQKQSAPEAGAAAEPVLIERRNTLRERVGGSLDTALTTQAEQAVSSLSTDFPHWMKETMARLDSARQAIGTAPITPANRDALYISTLEAKSLGETCGFPLVSRFGQSLARLLIRLPAEDAAPVVLVDAHLDAIRAALHGGASDNPAGSQLAAELEDQVLTFLRQRGA